MARKNTDGESLRRARLAARLKLREAAELLGVTLERYKNFESGRTKIPGTMLIEAIFKFQRQDALDTGLGVEIYYAGAIPGLVLPTSSREAKLLNETFWFERRKRKALLPPFLAREGRFLVSIEELEPDEDPFIPPGSDLIPGRDLLLIHPDPTPRANRLSLAEANGRHVLFAAQRSDPAPGRTVGYVVAILRDFGSSHGTLLWDEGGIIA